VKPRAPAPAEQVLALQRTVGNRAVSAMIARDAKPGQAEPKDAAPKGGSRATIELAELGKLPLLSYSSGAHQGPTGGSGVDKASKDMTLTTKVGQHSAKLMEAAAKGKPFDSAVIDAGFMVIHMKEVFITGVQVSGGGGEKDADALETWTINYGAIEWKYKKGEDE
jgi:hypothetical protein